MHALTQRLTINGVELAWDGWGAGPAPPLLLVHGFSGSAHDFALQIGPLAARRRVIAVDHRGHGRSAKLHDLAAYSIAQLVADLTEFVETAVGEPVDLLGHSMGGYVAVWFTLGRPDHVRSLILMDTSAWGFGTSERQDETAALLTAFDPALGSLPAGPPGPEVELINAATTEEWRAEKAVCDAAFDPYALKALGLELLTADLPSAKPRLGEVAVPVTVMAGANDHPFADQAPELAASLADSHLELIEGAYHSPQLTHPDAWRSIVEAHLSRTATNA